MATNNTSAEEPPLEILTPMTIHPHAKFSVFCSSPIRVTTANQENFTIHASTPMTLDFTNPIYVQSTGALDDRFANGWNRLPTELKVQILSYHLYSSKNIKHDGSKPEVAFLHHCLRATPEFGCLATGIFYQRNTFQLQSARYARGYKFSYPPPSVNVHVRRIVLPISLDAPWRYICKLAAGRYGFPCLQDVVLAIRGIDVLSIDSWQRIIEEVVESADKLMRANGFTNNIAFRSRGRVVLADPHGPGRYGSRFHYSAYLGGWERQVYEVVFRLIESRVSFQE